MSVMFNAQMPRNFNYQADPRMLEISGKTRMLRTGESMEGILKFSPGSGSAPRSVQSAYPMKNVDTNRTVIPEKNVNFILMISLENKV